MNSSGIVSPSVSAISVFYNRAHCAVGSIDSLIDQTYENLRIFLVDDGSTDDTLSKLKAFESDPRVTVVTGENQGFVKAIKACIDKHVTSDLVAIHGSGDVSDKDRISAQVEVFNRDPKTVVVGCWVNNVYEDSDELHSTEAGPARFDINLMLERNCFTHGEVMFKRSCYNEVGGYRTIFRFSQDRDLWLRMMLRGEGAIVQRFLYKRFIRRDGVHANHLRWAAQRMFSEAARRNCMVRMNCGRDLVDVAGTDGLYLVQGNLELAKSLRNIASKNRFHDDSRILEAAAVVSAFGYSHRLVNLYFRNRFFRSALVLIQAFQIRLRKLVDVVCKRLNRAEGKIQ